MKFQDKVEGEIQSWGDDVVTALLVAVALILLIIALRSNLTLKVAALGYAVLP